MPPSVASSQHGLSIRWQPAIAFNVSLVSPGAQRSLSTILDRVSKQSLYTHPPVFLLSSLDLDAIDEDKRDLLTLQTVIDKVSPHVLLSQH